MHQERPPGLHTERRRILVSPLFSLQPSHVHKHSAKCPGWLDKSHCSGHLAIFNVNNDQTAGISPILNMACVAFKTLSAAARKTPTMDMPPCPCVCFHERLAKQSVPTASHMHIHNQSRNAVRDAMQKHPEATASLPSWNPPPHSHHRALPVRTALVLLFLL